jgi:rubrerythrin
MRLAEPVQRPESGSAHPIGIVTCPNCRVMMARVSLKRLDGTVFNEATFRCPKCQAETRRFMTS